MHHILYMGLALLLILVSILLAPSKNCLALVGLLYNAMQLWSKRFWKSLTSSKSSRQSRVPFSGGLRLAIHRISTPMPRKEHAGTVAVTKILSRMDTTEQSLLFSPSGGHVEHAH